MAVDPLRTTIQFANVKQFLLSLDRRTRIIVLKSFIDFLCSDLTTDHNIAEDILTSRDWIIRYLAITRSEWSFWPSENRDLWNDFFNLKTNIVFVGLVKNIHPFVR